LIQILHSLTKIFRQKFFLDNFQTATAFSAPTRPRHWPKWSKLCCRLI